MAKEIFEVGDAFSTDDTFGSDVGGYSGLVRCQIRDAEGRTVDHVDISKLVGIVRRVDDAVFHQGRNEPKFVSFEANDSRAPSDLDPEDEGNYVKVRLRFRDVNRVVANACKKGLVK